MSAFWSGVLAGVRDGPRLFFAPVTSLVRATRSAILLMFRRRRQR